MKNHQFMDKYKILHDEIMNNRGENPVAFHKDGKLYFGNNDALLVVKSDGLGSQSPYCVINGGAVIATDHNSVMHIIDKQGLEDRDLKAKKIDVTFELRGSSLYYLGVAMIVNILELCGSSCVPDEEVFNALLNSGAEVDKIEFIPSPPYFVFSLCDGEATLFCTAHEFGIIRQKERGR